MLQAHSQGFLGIASCAIGVFSLLAVGAGCATSGSHTRSDQGGQGYVHTSPPEPDGSAVQRAIQAMDRGDTAGAIAVLEQVRERWPRNTLVLHELALAHRMARQPERAVALLKPHRDGLPKETLASLGSAYDETGDAAGAERVLRESLARFPNSGLLHSELATTLRGQGKTEQALALYRKGIAVEPTVAANYLHAATMLAPADVRGLALVYGETFRLMTHGAERSQAVARLMVEMCRRVVVREVRPDGTTAVTITVGADITSATPELAALGMFELAFATSLAALPDPELTLAGLHTARTALVTMMDETAAMMPWDDTPLFQWLRQLNAAGHLAAYDAWMFAPAFLDEAKAWAAAHPSELEAMISYVEAHPLF